MDDTRYSGPYTPARAWGCIAAVGFSVALYLPVQLAVMQFSPVRNEALLFCGAVALTFGLALGLGSLVRVFADWLLARAPSSLHPFLWIIPIVLALASVAFGISELT